jgi:hypothetical protein
LHPAAKPNTIISDKAVLCQILPVRDEKVMRRTSFQVVLRLPWSILCFFNDRSGGGAWRPRPSKNSRAKTAPLFARRASFMIGDALIGRKQP